MSGLSDLLEKRQNLLKFFQDELGYGQSTHAMCKNPLQILKSMGPCARRKKILEKKHPEWSTPAAAESANGFHVPVSMRL